MAKQQILSVFMTKAFREIWPDFLKYIDKAPQFRDFLANQSNQDGSKDKNFNKGKDSARIRFAVIYTMMGLKAVQKKAEKEGTFEDVSVEDIE